MNPTDPAAIFDCYRRLRETRPLVQNIANFVSMTISANVLLAAGASPAMVHAAEEAEDFSAIASSLSINIGTLSPDWVRSMKIAAECYGRRGKPWLLDPVGVGATRLRDRTAAELIALRPTAIRANAGEILALAGQIGATKGVDSTAGSNAAVGAAIRLAQSAGAIVAVTGETDYVTDGQKLVAIEGGHPLMPLSTALGCGLSSLCAAFLAVAEPMEALVSGLTVYAAAGKIAGSGLKGPGHLPAELCDALYNLREAEIAANARVRAMPVEEVA
jgi:hydroxyethylthiazole kinase